MRISHIAAAVAAPLLVLTTGCGSQVADGQRNAAGSIAAFDAGLNSSGVLTQLQEDKHIGALRDDETGMKRYFPYHYLRQDSSTPMKVGDRVRYQLMHDARGPRVVLVVAE